MRESDFIEENQGDWKSLETMLERSDIPRPDKLRRLFDKVSGDLSYARTFYKNRKVRFYLNTLMYRAFDKIQANTKGNAKDGVVKFYTQTLAIEIIRHRKVFLASLIIFLLGVLIGAFSTYEDIEFARLILGDEYIAMTESNINELDPMKVYKFDNSTLGFLHITIHNIRVSIIVFVLGVLAGVGSFFILLQNAIMVGTFQSYFATKGLFLTSFLTIWIHGTIEISSIVIAGAAGFILGKSLVFPGSYTRLESLKRGATSAFIIIISTVPLFVIAGFLESFVTRMTDLPMLVKVGIILFSLLIILSIYLVFPIKYYIRNGKSKNLDESHLTVFAPSLQLGTSESVHAKAMALITMHLSRLVRELFIPLSLMVLIGFWSIYYVAENGDYLEYDMTQVLSHIYFKPVVLASAYILILYAVISTVNCFRGLKTAYLELFSTTELWFYTMPLAAAIFAVIYLGMSIFSFAILFLVPIHFWAWKLYLIVKKKHPSKISVEPSKFWSMSVLIRLLIAGLGLVVFVLSRSSIPSFLANYLSWNHWILNDFYILQFVQYSLFSIILMFCLPYFYLRMTLDLEEKIEKYANQDLEEQLGQFGSYLKLADD